MRTNQEQLAMLSVQGKVDHPKLSGSGYRVGYDGIGRISMATGGITYSHQLGDLCMNIAGDHIEPGVSLKNLDTNENNALLTFSCVGNIARVVSGDAKGNIGYVTGKHGGIDHTMIYFDKETLDLMNCDDKVLIKAHGQGIQLLDYPQIQVMNLDPHLLQNINMEEKNNKVYIPIVTKIPAYLMGSGLGSTTMMNGDYDIMTQDPKAVQMFGLDQLRFGDLVLIEDHNNHNGPQYLQGSVSIGVIVHSDSYSNGHGPGVTILFSCKDDTLQGRVDADANLKKYLNIF